MMGADQHGDDELEDEGARRFLDEVIHESRLRGPT